MNRLTAANFLQNTAGASWNNSTIDFTVSNLAYDGNGNILSMNQKGFTVGSSALIDQLTYTYQPNSNKLSQVNDGANNPTSKLGDFHYTGTKQSTDYSYDVNGNLTLDNNKAISAIAYNYLNLPQTVTVTSKGTVSYTYDASGTKLYKTTVDNTVTPAKTTLTTYIGGFVYLANSPPTGGAVTIDTLQFIAHEEGRARWAYHKYTTGYAAYGFEYDFFEKDHLGNTRVVLTQQRDTAKYLASGEAVYRATEVQLFGNLTTTTIARTAAPGYPVDLTVTNPNDTVFKVNGNTGGNKTGPSLLLKVMSGDKIDLAVQEFYNSGTTPGPNSSIPDVLASLATGVVNMASGGKGSLTDLDNMTTSPIFGALTSFMTGNDPTPSGKPKAYLNWILLDDQLNYVSSYPQSGAMVVAAAGILNTLGYSGIPITKNGFLYIWVSNESQNWDVFFDNLRVVQYSGPELEETHYYPFGLTMAGISSKALKPNYIENKYKFNEGSELQNKEFSDGSGLELYETTYRGYDPQIGRFTQLDPIAELFGSWSPYAYAYDNPILFNDPLGLTGDTADLAPVTVVGYTKCKTNCDPPPPDVAGSVGPAPSSSSIKGPGESNSNDDDKDKGDHNVVTDAAYEINRFNPLAQAVNLGYTWLTGHDSYGVKQDMSTATANLAMTIPLGRAGAVANTLIEEGAASLFTHIPADFASQMARRGWTKELIQEVVNNPFTKRDAVNRATGNAATAFFTKEGAYVVRDNVTGELVQVSNKFDPNWIPDQSIVNPFKP